MREFSPLLWLDRGSLCKLCHSMVPKDCKRAREAVRRTEHTTAVFWNLSKTVQSVTIAVLCAVDPSRYWIKPALATMSYPREWTSGVHWDAHHKPHRHSVLKQCNILLVLPIVCLWQMLQDFTAVFVENNKLFTKSAP